LKITFEPLTTTIGSKLRTFQNSNEFRPNSSNFLLLFSFLFPFFARSTRRQPSRPPLSPPLSYALCPMQMDTREGSSRGKSCPRSHYLSLSLTLSTLQPQSAPPHRPGETPAPHLPVPARAKPLSLSFEAQGHPEHARADRGVGGKPPPATSPPGPPSHRRQRPMDGCRPRRPLATPQPTSCPRLCTVWIPRAASPFQSVHASFPRAPHVNLHGIEALATCHTCPARSATRSFRPCHENLARLLNPCFCPLAQHAPELRTHTAELRPQRRPSTPPKPPNRFRREHPKPSPPREDKTPHSLSSPALLVICPSQHSPLLCKLTHRQPPSPSPCPTLASSPENHRSRGRKGEGCCHLRRRWLLSSPSLAS
jgi:hypothetical protein